MTTMPPRVSPTSVQRGFAVAGRFCAGACALGAVLGAVDSAAQQPSYTNGLYAELQTSRGLIVIALDAERAPVTVSSFVGLAEGSVANDAFGPGVPYFDGTTFHRVVPGHVVQGGTPRSEQARDPGYAFPNEIHPELTHGRAGMVGMANGGPHTNASQFYVTLGDRSYLDGNYTVFGEVVVGLDVVEAIVQDDAIESVRIVRVGPQAQAFRPTTESFRELVASAEAGVRRDDERRRQAEEKFVADNWPDATVWPSGLRTQTLAEGVDGAASEAGGVAAAGGDAWVRYTGRTLGGRRFASAGQRGEPGPGEAPVRFRVVRGEENVNAGFTEVLSSMRPGDRRVAIVPASLAYGASGFYGRDVPGEPRFVISPNEMLVYQIEIEIEAIPSGAAQEGALIPRDAHLGPSEAAATSPEWERFRGPNGSGTAEAGPLPERLDPASNVIWSVTAPAGHSSPILSDDRLFITAFDDDKLLTLAYDRATGAELWRREAPRERVERLDSRNNPAAPSAAVDADRVVVFFADYGLIAYDHDGMELWRQPLGPFDNLYGMGASPLLHEGVVYLVCDQRTDSFLVALNAADGGVVWRVERPEAASSHATPIIYQPVGPDGAPDLSKDPQLLVVGSFLFSGYSMATGERLWWTRGMIHEMKSVPVIAAGVVFVNGYGSPLNNPGNTMEMGPFSAALTESDSDGDGLLTAEELPDGRAKQRFRMSDLDRDGFLSDRDWDYFRNSMAMTNGMFAIRLGGSGDTTSTSFLWRYSRAVPQLPSPVHYGGRLYMINDGGIVTILDPVSGESLDQGRVEGAIDSYYASPVAADGKINLISELGKTAVLRPGPTLDVISVGDLDDLVYATPAIADGRIYVRTRGTLYAFGLR